MDLTKREAAPPATSKTTDPSFLLDNLKEKKEEKPINVACAEDLCGSAEDQLRFSGLGKFGVPASEEAETFFHKKLAPELEISLDLSVKQLKTAQNLLGKFVKKSKSEALQPTVVGQLTFLSTLHLFQTCTSPEKFKDLLVVSDSQILLREDKAKHCFEVLGDLRAAKAITFLNLFLKSASQTNNRLGSYPFDYNLQYMAYVRGVDFKTNADQALQTVLENEELKAQRIIDSAGKYIFYKHDLSLLKKRSYLELTEGERRGLIDLFKAVNIMNELLREPMVEATRDLNLQAEEAIEILKIDSQIEKMMAVIHSKELASERKKLLNKCLTITGRAFAAAPTEDDKIKAKKMISSVKEAAKVVAEDFFGNESLPKIQAKIQSINILWPSTPKDLKERMVYSLRAENQKLKNFISEADQLENDPDWSSILPALISLFIPDTESESTPFTRAEADCKRFSPQPLNDAANSYFDTIVMSWQSMIFDETGPVTFAHELGHIASGTIDWSGKESDQNYNAVKSRSMALHSALKDPYAEIYTEEDWADAFGTAVVKKMGIEEQNFCNLVHSDEKTKEYVNLNLVREEGLEDDHSPGLLRAINMEIDMGRPLTHACKASVEERLPVEEFMTPLGTKAH